MDRKGKAMNVFEEVVMWLERGTEIATFNSLSMH